MNARERVRRVDIREWCRAPGCGSSLSEKRAVQAVYVDGELLGKFCQNCAQRVEVRELRKLGVKPFNGDGDQR
jgi:hypothetical protein